MSLGQVLHFICGADKLPATGFEVMPSICFTDLDMLPEISTCDISIVFSRSFGLLSYEEFKEKLDRAIRDSCGYGKT